MIRLIFVVLILALSPTLGAESTAQDSSFRVTTKIFSGKDAEPSAVHLILFERGLVYDLPQKENRFVTVFDALRQRVILLDQQTKVRSTITTDSLLKVTAQVRAAAEDPELRERLGLLAKPQTNDDGNTYTIGYGDIQYKTTTQTASRASIASQFGQFVDWAARLNIVRHRGLPPFGRLNLNQQMTAAGKLPRETTLSLRRGLKTESYRSTHELIEQISSDDRQQIVKVGGMLALYQDVDLADFPQ